MTSKPAKKSRSRNIAVILSILLCGLGQIYLRRTARGLILLLTFSTAIAIILLALYGSEVKISDWAGDELMFNPSRSITFREHTFHVSNIMKITGTIQLVLAWVFSIVDARRGER